MPSVSKAQRRFFGAMKGNPAEAKAKGISQDVASEYASTPEKGLPEKAASGDAKKKKGFKFPSSRRDL